MKYMWRQPWRRMADRYLELYRYRSLFLISYIFPDMTFDIFAWKKWSWSIWNWFLVSMRSQIEIISVWQGMQTFLRMMKRLISMMISVTGWKRHYISGEEWRLSVLKWQRVSVKSGNSIFAVNLTLHRNRFFVQKCRWSSGLCSQWSIRRQILWSVHWRMSRFLRRWRRWWRKAVWWSRFEEKIFCFLIHMRVWNRFSVWSKRRPRIRMSWRLRLRFTALHERQG